MTSDIGRVIFAESTTGKTTAVQKIEGLLDSDLIWGFWVKAQGLEGWKAVKDPSLMARFREESLPVFVVLVKQGMRLLSWDADLAEQVAREVGTQVTAYILRDADEYVARTLGRFEDGTKPRPPDMSKYTPDILRLNHKKTEDIVRSKFDRVVEMPADKYLSDYLRPDELPSIAGLSPRRW